MQARKTPPPIDNSHHEDHYNKIDSYNNSDKDSNTNSIKTMQVII